MKFWKSSVGRYSLSILIGIDQLVQVIMSPIMSGKIGDPDETISSRLGKMKLKYGGTIPWFHPLAGFIDWGCNKIDPGHSLDAIEPTEGEAISNVEIVVRDLLKK